MKSYEDRDRNDDRQCKLCGDECESVVQVLCCVFHGRIGKFVGREF